MYQSPLSAPPYGRKTNFRHHYLTNFCTINVFDKLLILITHLKHYYQITKRFVLFEVQMYLF